MTHYFRNDPNLLRKQKQIEFMINNKIYYFNTDSGVFSKKGLDSGTKLLLENLPLEEITGKVLDFGCGYGPIGIYISKNTNINVDMIDINERSIELTKKNAILNNVSINVFKSNIYKEIKEKYNYIISNPPIRVGKQILYEILFDAKKHLLKNGELWLVINKNQGAKTIVKDLQKEYSVHIIDKNQGFYIIRAINN